MNPDRVDIGVVGVGHLGRLHVQQLLQVAEAHLVGFYDINPRRAREIAAEFSIPAYPDFASLLQACTAVSIVTPTTTHYELARQALKAGRHVFVEKPMTSTIAQADELIRLARAQKLKLQVGHIERFNPAIVALEPLAIQPLFVESHRLASFTPRGSDVAVVLDLMIHDIDLILSFVSSPVREIHASGVSILSQTEDIANCRLSFENGCVANVTASRISTRKMRKMRFFQPNAYISVDFLAGHSDVYFLEDNSIPPHWREKGFVLASLPLGETNRTLRYARVEKADLNPLRYELQCFCQAILQDQEPPITGEDARRALQVAEQILQKIKEHTAYVQQHWYMNQPGKNS